MKYRNDKTGAVVNVSSKLGGVWKAIEEPKKEETKAEPKKTKKK